MTASSGAGETFDAAWDRFLAEHRARLEAWIESEGLVTESQLRGGPDFDAGDRLLATEAALHSAIIDFAAALPGQDNPSPLAVELLRRADAVLAGARAGRAGGATAPGSPGEEGRPGPGHPSPRPGR